MILAIILSVVLFRYVKRYFALNVDINNRSISKAYAIVYLKAFLIWCLLPVIVLLIQSLDDSTSPEFKGRIVAGALIFSLTSMIFGIGAGYFIIKKRFAETLDKRYFYSYTLITSGIISILFCLLYLVKESTSNSLSNPEHSRKSVNRKEVTVDDVREKFSEMKKQNAEKIDRDLIEKGFFSRDHAEQDRRFSVKEKLASEISDSVSKEMALAVIRIEKTIAYTARQVELAKTELFETGGLLNPVQNSSLSQIAQSRILLNNFSAANRAYGARVTNLKSLVNQEVGAVNGSDALKEYFSAVLYERINTALLISMVEQNTQFIEVGEALLSFYENTLTTRTHDDDGTVVFETDADLQIYDSLTSRLERVLQNKEAIARQYIDKDLNTSKP